MRFACRFDNHFEVFDPINGAVTHSYGNNAYYIAFSARNFLKGRSREQLIQIAHHVQNEVDNYFIALEDPDDLFEAMRDSDKAEIYENGEHGSAYLPCPLSIRLIDSVRLVVKNNRNICNVKGVGRIPLHELYATVSLWLLAHSLYIWEPFPDKNFEGIDVYNRDAYLLESEEAVRYAERSDTSPATYKRREKFWKKKGVLVWEFHEYKKANGSYEDYLSLDFNKKSTLFNRWIQEKKDAAKRVKNKEDEAKYTVNELERAVQEWIEKFENGEYDEFMR